MQKQMFAEPIVGNSTTLFNELDEYSKKRISLHKVEISTPNVPHAEQETQPKKYEYHMVIIDICMVININLSEATVINLVKSMK